MTTTTDTAPTTTTMPVYTVQMTFSGVIAGNNLIVDFTQSSESFHWVMATKSGISIVPAVAGGSFTFNTLQINGTKIQVQPAGTDSFTIKLAVQPTTNSSVLIGEVNLTTTTQLEVSIPSLNQRTIVVAGEPNFTLPLQDNN